MAALVGVMLKMQRVVRRSAAVVLPPILSLVEGIERVDDCKRGGLRGRSGWGVTVTDGLGPPNRLWRRSGRIDLT
jgi:hypothetical protein